MKKQYIIRKYIMASSLKEALKLEKKAVPDEAYIDESWLQALRQSREDAIGSDDGVPSEFDPEDEGYFHA